MHILALLMIAMNAAAKISPPAVVASVDLTRYMGTWYEIAAFPSWYQKGCTDTTVHYTLRDATSFDLLNTCWKGGVYKAYSGKGKVLDPATHAKIYVRFLPLLGTPYWIIDLDPNYRYAAVGVPKRNRLWIISRTPELDQKTYEGVVGRVKALGYDVSRLAKTTHTGKKLPKRI